MGSLSKQAIIRAAIIKTEDTDFVVRSILCPDILGVGETQEEAWQIFHELLDDYFDDIKANRPMKGPGRPTKGKVRLHAQIDPDIKKAVDKVAIAYKISQGEVIELMVSNWLSSNTQSKTT